MDTAQTDTVQLKVPAAWRDLLKARAADRGQPSVEIYILGLIADDVEPPYIDEETERLLIEGLESPLGPPVDEHFWAERRRKLDAYVKAKNA